MSFLHELHQYRESNRLEVKQSIGGLPNSLWATYSAFANTEGGHILLGVEELPDKSLKAIGVSNPEKLIMDFWNTVNNQAKVSINLLTDDDVRIVVVDGKRIVAISVPRAQRIEKPVYINNNDLTGTYRRNGEGDYHCSKEEVQAMLRDAAVKSQDMLVLEEMDLSVFNYESVAGYRQRMKLGRPNHVWEALKDNDFLYKLGAIRRDAGGHFRPTGAGLLMFGYEYEIVKEYPYYFLDYQEQMDVSTRWTDRIVSSSGDWSGNLYDFYFRVYNRIAQDIKVPFQIEQGQFRVEDTPVHKALREILVNCLVNADYYLTRGIVIIKRFDSLSAANPGGFRMDISEAISGGNSDPRNVTLMKMFSFLDIGERAGSGIPNIFAVWKEQGWGEPAFEERFNPDRTILTLAFNTATKANGFTLSPDNVNDNVNDNEPEKRILSAIEQDPNATLDMLAEKTGLSKSTVSRRIKKLRDDKRLDRDGSDKTGRWVVLQTKQ